jgi:hypothetical protein
MSTPYYAEAFYPAAGWCFRFVRVVGAQGQPTHCPAPPAWQGLFVAGNGRRYRVEACAGHGDPLIEVRGRGGRDPLVDGR